MRAVLNGVKVILRVSEPRNLQTAAKAAQWLTERPHQKDCILSYGNDDGTETDLYARRNKASVTVYELVEEPAGLTGARDDD